MVFHARKEEEASIDTASAGQVKVLTTDVFSGSPLLLDAISQTASTPTLMFASRNI